MQNLTKEQTLIEAIKQGDFHNVLDLVSQGIDLNLHDENLDTVFSIAAHYGQIKILEYLATNMKKNTHRHMVILPILIAIESRELSCQS